MYSGTAALYATDTLNPAGTYELEVEQTLKGHSSKIIHLNSPTILSIYYDTVNFHLGAGTRVLLILRTNKQGEWEAVDPTVPLIPLPSGLSGTYSDVASLLLGALPVADSNLRQVYTYFLRSTVNPQVVIGLTDYINDPNIAIQDNVLRCLANNQQLGAIPRIKALAEKAQAKGVSVTCTASLESYKDTPDAKPLLEPLLFCPEYFSRFHTMLALDHLVDHNSIPYLMLAIRDPDEQNFISQSAYGLLHELIPILGEAYGNDYFAQHRAVETKKISAWWSDELLGKHLKPGEHPAIPAQLPNTPALLNPLLFLPDTPTRRAVADKLARLGDKSSIPYLVLALQDPDTEVAFTAYKTLHRLIPSLGNPVDRTAFAASPTEASQPVYDWWRDELLGKHLPK